MILLADLEVYFQLMKQYNVSNLEVEDVKITMSNDLTKPKTTVAKIDKIHDMMPTEEELLYGSTKAPDPFALIPLTPRKKNGS